MVDFFNNYYFSIICGLVLLNFIYIIYFSSISKNETLTKRQSQIALTCSSLFGGYAFKKMQETVDNQHVFNNVDFKIAKIIGISTTTLIGLALTYKLLVSIGLILSAIAPTLFVSIFIILIIVGLFDLSSSKLFWFYIFTRKK